MLCYYVMEKNKGGSRDESKDISSIYPLAERQRDRFDYTQWRQEGLLKINLKELAQEANTQTNQLGNPHV